MRKWCEDSKEGGNGGIEKMVREWRRKYDKVVKEGVGWNRRGGNKFRVKDVEIDKLKEEMRRIQRDMMKCGEERREELKEERRKNRAELQRRVRIGRNKIKLERMRKIEEEKDRGGLIKKLEAWSGKRMGVTGGGEREDAR